MTKQEKAIMSLSDKLKHQTKETESFRRLVEEAQKMPNYNFKHKFAADSILEMLRDGTTK